MKWSEPIFMSAAFSAEAMLRLIGSEPTNILRRSPCLIAFERWGRCYGYIKTMVADKGYTALE